MQDNLEKPEMLECAKRLPAEMWEKLRPYATVPTGAEALRPLLKIIAQEIFDEWSGIKNRTKQER
jgi:hypothetical protein